MAYNNKNLLCVADKNELTQKKISDQIPGLYAIYRPPPERRTLPPHVPKGKLYLLKPRIVQPHNIPEHKKVKPPKFIPFEPYPCAITEFNKTFQKKIDNKKTSHILQQSCMKSTEVVISDKQTNSTRELPESVIKLKKERDFFKNQFKMQIQINSEIKSLLFAAVGQDLQNNITEMQKNKLHITKVLLDTMNDLSTHTEQIELLSGQCEVWRSKFLAGSVMIEKLANWKTDLARQKEILINTNFKLLKLIENLRFMHLEILRNLICLSDTKKIDCVSGDVITLSQESLNITQLMLNNKVPKELNFENMNPFTEVEKFCLQSFRF
ncbi:golgin-45 isoform X2 [Condylostylus longicornis]|uniref:golgin-45 isoform X2 n=1 Tax=Condylostylus longicornis TaxID=2530218 RepID=UPI00244E2D8B|nr:golgin-45 isoform X2 [Condylostylus longicornis]